MTTERDAVKTGIFGLDAILSDGIPRGNVILIEGAIGSGKTTIGVEFAREPECARHARVRDRRRQGDAHSAAKDSASVVRPFSSYLNLISRNPARGLDPGGT